MKIHRRENEPVSIAFLDVITCGFGAIILLLMIAKVHDPPAIDIEDPRAAQIAKMQRDLFDHRRDVVAAEHALVAKQEQLTTWRNEATRMQHTLAALRSTDQDKKSRAALNAVIAGELRTAQQELTEEMRRLYAQRDRKRTDLIGGIPIDSEYIIFIIDTSGSMFRYAWPKVVEQIVQTLEVYPKVKGIQILNDMGTYMFSSYRGKWIPDTPGRRRIVIERLLHWNAFSNSSPVEGIMAAIRTFYSPNKKISLFVYGDEFTGKSIRQVVEFVGKINQKDASGKPRVRIHAIGFPVMAANPPHLQITGIRFATLMRELTRRNGGTFVGLNRFR
ncbi:MAG: VWA domain-containing protein [Proteobacteria bacterium]|nr:MAG: VWA domain-containing protein [Pseudomonadota bacterium]